MGIVDATAETRTHLTWRKNREALLEVSCMWEDHIRKAHLSRASLNRLEGEALEKKKEERRKEIEHIIESIINSGIIDFPVGVRPRSIISLLARGKDGELSHEDFTISLGRLLLADNSKLMFLLLINQAKGTDLVRDLMGTMHKMEAKLEQLDTKIEDMRKRKQ